MVTQHTHITASDINSIITLINTESTRRSVSGSLSSVTQYNKVTGESGNSPYDMANKLVSINAAHCNCEADGGTQTHSGGNSLTLTSTVNDYNAEDSITSANINEIATDRTSLAAQCDCDSHACSCESANCSGGVCDCDGTDCSCNTQCSTHCTSVCSCNGHCCDDYCNCVGNMINVSGDLCDCQSCNGTNCSCNTQCSSHCTSVCNCDGTDCSCNTQTCTCNDVCSCEYGG